MLKLKIVFYLASSIFLGTAFSTSNASAQSIAYRQTDLASNVPNLANNLAPALVNPWGIGFLSGQPFFIANNKSGRVTAHDATGLSVRPGSFIVPDVTGTRFETPTGIVADQNSSFGSASVVKPFILVTEQGSIFTWGPDAQGNLPQQATAVRRRVSAVYKGVAILKSSLTAPVLAVADFHQGFIDTFLSGFVGVTIPGSFTDPTLPAGYAPFGIQVIGNQVFVTYALQDAAKHDPIAGAGNGVVSIFDMDGNFVQRFATGGALNAPWGIAKASANFGPFSNDILIANAGDGTINAFDPTTGHFVGVLVDGDGSNIVEVGLHGLAFRTDGFADPNTLFFASQVNNENDGLMGAIAAGLVSTIRITVPNPIVDASATITASVAAGPGNGGSPTGTVTFLDGTTQLKTVPLVNGSASVDTIFVNAGIHPITAQYNGDRVFLPRHDLIPMQVAGNATTSTLTAPADAVPGSAITITATINSAGGIPTGQVAFLDGSANIGTASLNDAGVATLRTNTLTAGTHSLTAIYSGDTKFETSTSRAVTLTVASADFSVGAVPATANVIAGHSTQFMLTVTPAGGFVGNVAFSCAAVTGITCTFNPSTVSTANGAASTALTVGASASVSRYGFLTPGLMGPGGLLLAIVVFVFAMRRAGNLRFTRVSPLAAGIASIVLLCLAIGGCGGYGNGSQANRGTATIMVTAHSGAISHTTTVNVTVQ